MFSYGFGHAAIAGEMGLKVADYLCSGSVIEKGAPQYFGYLIPVFYQKRTIIAALRRQFIGFVHPEVCFAQVIKEYQQG